ncbi:hypothetical protein RRG08_032932 [Elysia crispata]|uniref:Uncharacterized protein n=1 Tax=Elysia crispata TaxID=231223 RepID=A0AAE1A7R8_9GAST|nr:hypothetical protein RRG08_032932 [Elysia crispata]
MDLTKLRTEDAEQQTDNAPGLFYHLSSATTFTILGARLSNLMDSAEANHREWHNLSSKGSRAREQFHSGGHNQLSHEIKEAEFDEGDSVISVLRRRPESHVPQENNFRVMAASQKVNHGQNGSTGPSAYNELSLSNKEEVQVGQEEFQGCSASSNSSSFYVNQSQIDSCFSDSAESSCQPEALHEHPYAMYKNQLRMSARCEEDDCNESGCKEIKTLLLEIRKILLPASKPLTDIHGNLLVCMYEHCITCNSQPCTFPWCSPQLCMDLPKRASRAEVIEFMHRWISCSVTDINLGQVASLQQILKINIRERLTLDGIVSSLMVQDMRRRKITD